MQDLQPQLQQQHQQQLAAATQVNAIDQAAEDARVDDPADQVMEDAPQHSEVQGDVARFSEDENEPLNDYTVDELFVPNDSRVAPPPRSPSPARTPVNDPLPSAGLVAPSRSYVSPYHQQIVQRSCNDAPVPLTITATPRPALQPTQPVNGSRESMPGERNVVQTTTTARGVIRFRGGYRPIYAPGWWYRSNEQIESMDTRGQANFSNMGLIMETQFGRRLENDDGCEQCRRRNVECWAFTPEGREIVAYATPVCAHCRERPGSCSLSQRSPNKGPVVGQKRNRSKNRQQGTPYWDKEKGKGKDGGAGGAGGGSSDVAA